MKKKQLLPAVFAGIAWSTTGLFVTGLIACGFDTVTIASGRCIFGALSAFLFVLLTNRRALKITLPQLAISLLGGASFFTMAFAYYQSIHYSTASIAASLLYTEPAMIMLVSVLFFGERLTWKKLVALPLLVVGCGLVSGFVGGGSISAAGIIYGLLSAVFYTLYSVCSRLSGKLREAPTTFTVYCFLGAAITSLFFASPVETVRQLVASPWYTVWLLIGFGVVTGSFAGFAYTLAMQELPASVAAAIATLEPLLSAVWSVLFLHEQLTVSLGIGVVLILGSVLLVNWDG